MPPPKKFFFRHRKKCKFCEEKMHYVDYKNVRLLDNYVTERGKMLPRKLTGNCARHQRADAGLAIAAVDVDRGVDDAVRCRDRSARTVWSEARCEGLGHQ